MNTTLETSDTQVLPLSQRLKEATHAQHERIDNAVMALKPFASHDGYVEFLKVQYCFHRHTEPFYRDAALAEWIDDLPQRCRFPALVQDCADLGVDTAALDEPPGPHIASPAEAVGWLYVNEGSNLGAAFLFKYAVGLGLSGDFGARHLAPSDDGRGLHWRRFVERLDVIELTGEQAKLAIKGAQDAFAYVETLTAPRLG